MKSITNANAATSLFSYDIQGQESSQQTPLGGKTQKIRDELGRLGLPDHYDELVTIITEDFEIIGA